ncbi:MAG: hypothetical protein MZV64_01765 [Ignavibacteriales bacterium]|nr:hypothetical protein [Ignavibacteriales bacterium]
MAWIRENKLTGRMLNSLVGRLSCSGHCLITRSLWMAGPTCMATRL